jgi:hypothetical protein
MYGGAWNNEQLNYGSIIDSNGNGHRHMAMGFRQCADAVNSGMSIAKPSRTELSKWEYAHEVIRLVDRLLGAACGGTEPTGDPPLSPLTSCRNSEPPEQCRATNERGVGGNQGVFLEGSGLERTHFTPQAGAAIAFSPGGVAIDHKDTVKLTPAAACGAAGAALTLTSCDPLDGVQGAIKCLADVQDTGGICTSRDSRGNEQDSDPEHHRGVLVVRGQWDATGAWHDEPNTVTVSCAAGFNTTPDAQFPAGDGSITKCILQFKLDPATQQDAFLACIRMARADYCGDGITHTFTGTEIRVSTPENPTTKAECGDGMCFEASWSKDGAVCIQHVRYDGPDAGFDNCKDQFKLEGRLQCRAPAEQGIVVSHSQPRTCGRSAPGTCELEADPVCATP